MLYHESILIKKIPNKMPNAVLRPGVGAEFTVFKRNIHPKRKVERKYPNFDKREDKLEGFVMIREGIARTSGQNRNVYFFTHIDFETEELYCCRGFSKITKEGSQEGLFGGASGTDNDTVAVPDVGNDADEDVARFIALGITVDDDSTPAPENIPLPSNDETQPAVTYEDWDSAFHCNRATSSNGRVDAMPSLINEPLGSDLLEWFKFFLPMRYLMNVLLRRTNQKIDGPHVTEGEFLKYIGIWLLLATVKSGPSVRSFWDSNEPNPFYGAPFRCHHYMSRRRFENITKSLTYTDRPRPSYVDKLFEVRQLLNSFNLHMRSIFLLWMGGMSRRVHVTMDSYVYMPRFCVLSSKAISKR